MPNEPVDIGNIVKAMERTPGRVIFVESNKKLDRILEHPFAAWRIFLHPAQRKIAYAPRYAGPAQVSGGARTGPRPSVPLLHGHPKPVPGQNLSPNPALTNGLVVPVPHRDTQFVAIFVFTY